MKRSLKIFQREAVDALSGRFAELTALYEQASDAPSEVARLRQLHAATLFQAPTGSGKTLMATEFLSAMTEVDDVLWLWFTPFGGLIRQTEEVLLEQSPELKLLRFDVDRRPDTALPGSVMVTTWQSVAAKSEDSRRARRNDDMMSIDRYIAAARARGLRIGCVVDEAHHGFKKAAEARRFFVEVLQPDFALLMTATPRDADALLFSKETGYELGDPATWASVSRQRGVDEGILKRGVKMARFIAKAEDAPLVDYERLALAECAAIHRALRERLAKVGAGGTAISPLMLVQVPNGDEALEKARAFLIESLHFPEQAVRVHTAKEPDAHLASLANDPQIEVLLFKMAVATGFDAPRAFTLAALRGARDPDWGVQIVGRLMRVHPALQGRRNSADDHDPALDFGYVFLADAEAQTGLREAGARINRLQDANASLNDANNPLGSQTVVTLIAGEPQVQVVKNGTSLSLFPATGSVSAGEATPDASDTSTQAGFWPQLSFDSEQAGFALDGGRAPVAGTETGTHSLTSALLQDSRSTYAYALRAGMPTSFQSEFLPLDVDDDFEEKVVAHIVWEPALRDAFRENTAVVERIEDLFAPSEPEDRQVWAKLSPEALKKKADQCSLFGAMDAREFRIALEQRFARDIQPFRQPANDEEMRQMLDRLLVRNPHLVKEAVRTVRAKALELRTVHLADRLLSDLPLSAAKRNVYGVFPADLNGPEQALAEQLDIANNVLWWHRNDHHKHAERVGLYGWSLGIGFYPDFIVGIADRPCEQGVALIEFKGKHLQSYDAGKASAVHQVYGPVFFVGPDKQGNLHYWKEQSDKLEDAGAFDPLRLRFVSS